MTLFHFLNCALLCYAPSFILYRALKLCVFATGSRCLMSRSSDYRAVVLCIYAGIGFALTELLKVP